MPSDALLIPALRTADLGREVYWHGVVATSLRPAHPAGGHTGWMTWAQGPTWAIGKMHGSSGGTAAAALSLGERIRCAVAKRKGSRSSTGPLTC